ncbi:heterokaryon incompatibility protein-domain-containing protein [Podospora australis]|uniref:Heterokaryon incompatibility protein-domain-containing protein n=1 Tax=Podospora australis TaxID=1536484 RepID=A0AAN6WHE1_9PEZI|nr:heterokaryon incompatibility protein-domain-containing protein [Podospora australis]
MICNVCLTITLLLADEGDDGNWHEDHWIYHHNSFADLDKSAHDGCEMCKLFKLVLLEKHAHELACSIEEAVEAQRLIDVEENYRYEENGEMVRDPRSFAVKFDCFKLASDAPYHDSAQRLFFFRKGEDALDIHHAFVNLSAPSGVSSETTRVRGSEISSSANFNVARNWLDACAGGHGRCPRNINSALPRRILDLGDNPALKSIHLLVDSDFPAAYATLSHCWGTTQPLKLTNVTLHKFQSGINFDDLPRTFQHAITATLALGLRYLWIDSLCIIQDSKQDWEEQCAQMCRIYRDSFVTIAGPAAGGCHARFLHQRPMGAKATFDVKGRDGVDVKVTFTQGSNFDKSDFDDYEQGDPQAGSLELDTNGAVSEREQPLLQRAWVLQERLLSSRILYFGASRMYLECFTNVQVEGCRFPVDPRTTYTEAIKIPVMQLNNEQDRVRYWERIVKNYSSLGITNITDRLPALSGIAVNFHQVSKSQYVAGLWVDQLPQALAWYIRAFEEDRPSMEEYVAPSWSWASAGCPVIYHSRIDGPFTSSVKLLSIDVKPSGLDPFGTVQPDAYIEMSGKVWTARVSKYWWIFEVHSGKRKTETSWVAKFHPDAPKWGDTFDTEVDVLFLFLGSKTHSVEGRPSRPVDIALAIEPVDSSQDVYRRIGLADNELVEGGGAGLWKSCFDEAETQTVRLI